MGLKYDTRQCEEGTKDGGERGSNFIYVDDYNVNSATKWFVHLIETAHSNISSRTTLYWRRCLRYCGRSCENAFPRTRARRGKISRSATQENTKPPIARANSRALKLPDKNVNCITWDTHFGGAKSMQLEIDRSVSIVSRKGADSC